MKVTVKDYLNVRIGKPSVNAPTYQYLAPGSILDVDGQLYKGDPYEGVDTWVKDAAGNYYWSGGIDTSSLLTAKLAAPLVSLMDYNKLMKTVIALPANFGVGINVALLDSGVNVHNDLQGAVADSRSFITGLSATNDVWGHGTMMAGLIAGRASTKGIRGVAPSCHLYNYRVINDQGNTDMKALLDAFDHIIHNQAALNIKIINLSLSVSDLAYVSDRLTTLAGLGIKLVVAGGDQKVFKYGVRLLANHPNTIGVGILDADDYLAKGGTIPDKISCFYYDQPLFSCSSHNTAGYEEGTGDSIYTALTSGVFAVVIAAQAPSLTPYLVNRNSFNKFDITPYN